MAAGKTESVTEVKTLVGERGLLVYKSLGKISIPPRRKRETIAQKNLCQKKCGNRGYVVRVRKRDQRNFMNKIYCFACIGGLVVKDSCDVKPKRVVT